MIERNSHQKACFLYADNDLAFLHTKLFSSIITNPHLKEFFRDGAVKNILANAGDERDGGSIPGSGRSPGEGNGNQLQYSCLENPMARGAWWAIVHRMAKSKTRLSTGNLRMSFRGRR